MPDAAAKVRMAMLAAVCGLFVWSGFWLLRECLVRYHLWGFDLGFRHSEIACAHEGIDPFDIWNRTVVSDRFRGWNRPDKPAEPPDGRLKVHAYPAWHMAPCWWYGSVPWWLCASLMGLLYACSLVWSARWCVLRLAAAPGHPAENALFLLALYLHPLGGICLTMNYGLLLLGTILLMGEALDRGRDALAGVLYSVVLFKPQIGLLLALPLLVGRRFKTLAVTASVCLAETLFASWKLGKPPWELLLQIPAIGAPYAKGFYAEMAGLVAGNAGPLVAMAAFAALASAGCWLVRKAPAAWMRFVPALAVAPFWTYSQPHDWLVTLPCSMGLLLHRDRHPRLYGGLVFLVAAWGAMLFASAMHRYFPFQKTLLGVSHLAILLACCVVVVAEARREPPPGPKEMEERHET